MALIAYTDPRANLDAQVNGVNTVFTTTNNISTIDSVVFDGAPYLGTVTITGAKEVTLEDAPTVSLRIGYYTSIPVSAGVSEPILVSEAIARLQRAYNDDLGEVSNDLYFDWLSELNYMMYRYLYKNDPSAFINSVPFAIEDGVTAYDLPADFKDMKVRGCGIFKNTPTGSITESRLFQTGAGSTQTGFYLDLDTFVITPGPTSDSSVTMRYIPKILPITATTDYLVVDIEHFQMVINFLDKMYGQWNLDTVKEMSADQRFAQGLSQLLSDTHRLPKTYSFR